MVQTFFLFTNYKEFEYCVGGCYLLPKAPFKVQQYFLTDNWWFCVHLFCKHAILYFQISVTVLCCLMVIGYGGNQPSSFSSRILLSKKRVCFLAMLSMLLYLWFIFGVLHNIFPSITSSCDTYAYLWHTYMWLIQTHFDATHSRTFTTYLCSKIHTTWTWSSFTVCFK